MVKSKPHPDVSESVRSRIEASVEEHQKEVLELAHDLKDVNIGRTDDILAADDVAFENLLLPDFIVNGLSAANFHRPSPIQLRSIPLLRLGLDLIVQSKAGTGKTLVITLAALETVKLDSKRLQVLVLAPTREIALQTKHFISIICSDAAVRTEVFIGGTSVKDDKKKLLGCQIAIGTPGRLNSLLESGDMLLGHVRLFVLDEADKLMDESIFSQIKSISKLLPPKKQTILCSATFQHPVKSYVVKHMNEPFWVTPEEASRFQTGHVDQQKSASTVLLGVTQFVKEVLNHAQIVRKLRYKLEEILEILSGHSFTQCMIFSNYQSRAETICHQLVSNGWPALSVRGQDDQAHRTATMDSFKKLGCRILLTTDVMSRGVDFRGVDLVINLDIPYDSSTYLHRMGRAGRFGSHGCVITLASQGEEIQSLQKILSEINGNTVYVLPSEISRIKLENKYQTVYFGPSTKLDNAESDCQDENLGTRSVGGKEIKCGGQMSENVREEKGQSVKEHVKTKHIDQENNDPQKENFTYDGTKKCLKPTPISGDSRKVNCIQEANNHLFNVLCVPKPEPAKFLSFEELEKMLPDCAIENKDKCEIPASSELPKPKDWWASANIVLTAAKLQLNELRKKAQESENLCTDSNSEISDSSSECDIFPQPRVGLQISKEKKRPTKVKNDSVNSSSFQRRQTSDLHGTVGEDFTWHWDETSKVYYVWDGVAGCYQIYNPYMESYFKWEPKSNSYFKWDSLNQSYKMWNCELNCFYETNNCESYLNKAKVFSKNTRTQMRSPDQDYLCWFSLWNKHLKQMSWQVYQAEYLKNLTGVHLKN